MARYLDPKNDLTFKRIFGEHPRLPVSFLNVLMPQTPGWLIESVEYLSSDLLANKEIKEAHTLCGEGAFTAGELEWYEHCRGWVRTEKGLVETAKAEGPAERETKGLDKIALTAYQNNFPHRTDPAVFRPERIRCS
ncbi:MAG: hypothetical protein LBS42_00375 [Tannerella sp.]|jgi:hypothetical protein|nr:hypothetical protein [Tannerella sp.]